MAWKGFGTAWFTMVWYPNFLGSAIRPCNPVGCRYSGGQLPILTDFKHGCGFIHRLDVPSSGLVIAASTYDPLAWL